MLQLCCKTETPGKLTVGIDIAGGLAIFTSSFFSFARQGSPVSPILVCICYIMLRSIVQLYQKKRNPVRQLSASCLATLITVIPLSLLNNIYFAKNGSVILLASLIFIWINDTGAYCVGTLFGKHRLFERISPKKSWEGFFGGLLFTIAAGLLFGFCFHEYFHSFTAFQWVGFATTVSVFSTWGDLIESMIKRASGTKDSGNILPGHGGMLDRIDSLLLVVPAVLIYTTLIL